MKVYTVYILQCNDYSYYTGFTGNLERRLYWHRVGYFRTCYTYRRRPVRLVYAAHFHRPLEAIAWEKHLKRWSVAKKKALIEGQWDVLSLLSTCRNISQCFRDPTLRYIRYDVRHKMFSSLYTRSPTNLGSKE